MDTFVPKGNISGPILPEFILNMPIPAGAKFLYALLCKYSFTKGYCWYSHSSLAEKLGCSVNSVKNYCRALADAGLLAIKKENYRSSIFYLVKPSADLLNAANEENGKYQTSFKCPSEVSNFDGNLSKVEENPSNFGYLKDLKKEIKENPPLNQLQENAKNRVPNESQKGCVDFSFADFEKVFEAYPRKESRGTARTAWRSMLSAGLLPPVSVILEAIERFKAGANWQRENGRFIPYLANFLKGERWNDPLSPDEVEEKKKTESAKQIRQLQAQKEEQLRKESEKKRARLKPLFDEFAAKFIGKFHMPMVFGMWLARYEEGIAPLAADVPHDNTLAIVEFIRQFGNRKKYPPNNTTPKRDKDSPSISGAQNSCVAVDSILPDKAINKKSPVPLPDSQQSIHSAHEVVEQIMNGIRGECGRKRPSQAESAVFMVA